MSGSFWAGGFSGSGGASTQLRAGDRPPLGGPGKPLRHAPIGRPSKVTPQGAASPHHRFEASQKTSLRKHAAKTGRSKTTLQRDLKAAALKLYKDVGRPLSDVKKPTDQSATLPHLRGLHWRKVLACDGVPLLMISKRIWAHQKPPGGNPVTRLPRKVLPALMVTWHLWPHQAGIR